MKKLPVLLPATAIALAFASTASAQVLISGYTTGCFYQGPLGAQCASGTANASIKNGGGTTVLSFSGGSFSGNVGPGGYFNLDDSNDNLGSFTKTSTYFNFNPSGPNNDWNFRLFVTITSPVTTPTGATFIGEFDGDVNFNSSNDELEIDFSSTPALFQYNGGEFRLSVFDIDKLEKNDTDKLYGKISCKTEGPKVWNPYKKKYVDGPDIETCGEEYIPPPPVVTTPEPSTYALMAAGLMAVGFVSRRRRKA